MIYFKHFCWLLPGCLLLSFPLFANNLILSCPHKDISFKVELAETPKDQENGLMFRKYLAENEGMLFLYSSPQPVAMWMKNTPLSLDMIFGDKSGNILAIYENALPYSLRRIGPVDGASQVLEVNGGTVKKNNITKNCSLIFEY